MVSDKLLEAHCNAETPEGSLCNRSSHPWSALDSDNFFFNRGLGQHLSRAHTCVHLTTMFPMYSRQTDFKNVHLLHICQCSEPTGGQTWLRVGNAWLRTKQQLTRFRYQKIGGGLSFAFKSERDSVIGPPSHRLLIRLPLLCDTNASNCSSAMSYQNRV